MNNRSDHAVFLFGEAERGQLCTPLLFHSLEQLAATLGNPPQDSSGIDYAVQTLLYGRDLLFYRVEQEGYSISQYMQGLKLLQNREIRTSLSAICMPGVGQPEVIDAGISACAFYKSVLVLTPKDLYDYFTAN
jgi:hypothetical protein